MYRVSMGDYRKLEVWKRAYALALHAYRVTARYPRTETYGLVSQIRRSSVSVAANIAEGCGRNTDGELARFLRIALGSLTELDCHFMLSRDLHLADPDQVNPLIEEGRELRAMLATLATRCRNSRPE